MDAPEDMKKENMKVKDSPKNPRYVANFIKNLYYQGKIPLPHYITIIDSLDRAVAAKPINYQKQPYPLDPGDFGRCPHCETEVNSQANYCWRCGQKLKWERMK